jgi:prepilin-type N-terminal cleavage/methylation domain-containing protein
MNRGITNTVRQRGRNVDRAHGFTLLEILVVLVILLIGILAILRLFPGGFLTIKRTAEQTMAQALSQQQLDSLKNTSVQAEAILPAFPQADDSYIVAQDIMPNDLSEATNASLAQYGVNSLPNGLTLKNFSDINQVRLVVGENVTIPVPNANAAKGYGSVYVLQFGPVYNEFGGDDNNPTDRIKVYGAPLERVEQSSTTPSPVTGGTDETGTAFLNSPSQYAIDYTDPVNPKIAFYPRIGTGLRQFLIRFDYYALPPAGSGIPVVETALDKTITVPDVQPSNEPPQPKWIALFDTNAGGIARPDYFYQFKRDSEVVSRRFRLVSKTPGTQPAWTDDPYEYAWFSPQEGNVANVGVLVFNPRGHDYLERTAAGTQTLTARVDYAILDNHIIHEDRVVPTSAPYALKLSLPFVLTTGDILEDQTQYNGLFPSGGNDAPDVLLVNVSTGEEIGHFSKGQPDSGLGASSLDTKTGVIRLDPNIVENTNNSLKSATIRAYYKAQGDWGMQVQKAYARYDRAFQPSETSFKAYYIDTTGTSSLRRNRMYFRLCDAGKMVILGEFFLKDKNDKIIRLSNEAYRINDNPALFETVNGIKLTWIDLTEQHSEASTDAWQWTDDVTGQAVSSVQGGSIKSRVIWKSAERWRKVDTDTFLPQAK